MEPVVKIDPSLLHTFPEIRLGCLCYEAQVEPPREDFWAHMDGEVIPAAQKMLQEKELADIPGIHCSREAYKAFGRSPSRYRVSSESLLRRIRQGNPLYRINSVVDVNNLISVECALSVGSYDLDNLSGPVTLRVGQAGQGYEGIGKSFIDMEKMLLLSDDLGIFGSPTSDSHRAMIGEGSRRILTVIYCFSNDLPLEQILARAQSQFETYTKVEHIRHWIVT